MGLKNRELSRILNLKKRFWSSTQFHSNHRNYINEPTKVTEKRLTQFITFAAIIVVFYYIPPLITIIISISDADTKQTLPFICYGETAGLDQTHFATAYFLEVIMVWTLFLGMLASDGLFLCLTADAMRELRLIELMVSGEKFGKQSSAHRRFVQGIKHHILVLQYADI